MECRSCQRPVLPKTRFCDDCGEALAQILQDAETLQSFCGKCGVKLQGSRRYCVQCGHPSPLASGRQEKTSLEQLLMSTKVQAALVAVAIMVAFPLFWGAGDQKKDGERVEITSSPADDATLGIGLPSGFKIVPVLDALGELSGDDGFFQGPVALARNAAGDLFIADILTNVVMKVSEEGVERFAGSGRAGFGQNEGLAAEVDLNGPSDIATDRHGKLYIADTNNDAVRVVDQNGVMHTIAGKRDEEGNPLEGQPHINRPINIWVDDDGTVYVTESPCASDASGELRKMWALEPLAEVTQSEGGVLAGGVGD